MIFGGLQIKTMRATNAWGVTAASTTATMISPLLVSVGATISMNFFGLFTHYGIVTRVVNRTDFSTGTEQDVEMVDNRIRLQWQHVFAAWNMEDENCNQFVQADLDHRLTDRNESSGGSDDLDFDSTDSPLGPDTVVFPAGYVVNPERRRRYWSIAPEHWQTRTRTYHNKPLSVRQILNSAFNGSVGHQFGFSRSYTSRADAVFPLGVDHLNGTTMANLISQMNDKTGLDCYLSGRSFLRWDIKGAGSMPMYGGGNDESFTRGTSLSTEPTRIRIMGDPIVIQVLNVELEPTWNRKWEKFIGEAAWLREVAAKWGINEKTHWAEIAARAREITVAEYCQKINDKDWADYGYYGQYPRMSMPVWSYIEELVFKHYAVRKDKKLFGTLPQDSIRIADNLLCNVQMSGMGLEEDAKMEYQKAPLEYYPGAKAFVMVKGQPLDALDTRDIEAFHRLRIADTRKTWRVVDDYEIDSCGIGIRFRVPVFIDGDPSKDESIFSYPNKGEAGFASVARTKGIAGDSMIHNVVIPNAKYKIEPAKIKASFAFTMGSLWEEFGKGPRYGVINANGLTAHLLHVADGSFSAPGIAHFDAKFLRLPAGSEVGAIREILYADGDSAMDKAKGAWISREGNAGKIEDGNFKRIGVIGTQIGGAVDRVSISIGFGEGVNETVDVMKQRIDRAFIAEKTMNRLRRISELYSGHEQLKQEIRNLRRIVEADRYKPQSTKKKSTSHKTLNDVERLAIGGGIDVQTRVSKVTHAVKACEILWQDAGVISDQGKSFAGVAIHSLASDDDKGNINLAYAGQIPVKLSGKFQPGDVVYASPGDKVGTRKLRANSVPIGVYTHSDEVDDDAASFVGIVQIGFGGKGIIQTLQPYDLKSPNGIGAPSTVKLTKGFVINIDPAAAGKTKALREIKVSPLFDNESQDFSVSEGDVIGVSVTTDPKDNVLYAEVSVKKDPIKGTHAIPDPVNQHGDYFYKIAKFGYPKDASGKNVKGASLDITELYHCGGPIHHHFKINEIINRDPVDTEMSAEDFNLYVKWIESGAHHHFRKLWQHVGRGEAILIKQLAPNQGNDPDYEILHVRIAERETNPQIRLVTMEDGKVLEIRGNSKDGSLVWENCDGSVVTLLEWRDGLNITEGEQRIIAGCDGSGNPHEGML